MVQLRVEQLGQGQRIGVIADVLGLEPGKPGVGAARAGLSHFRQAQIEVISQQGRQQQCRVFSWCPGFQMREVTAEPGPLVDEVV